MKHPPRPLPAGTPIIDVFDQMAGALLILGAPGIGKTTLLLELARDLIGRAEQDEGYPIPVVFNLSSWAQKQRPLKEWLVEELNTKYDVPRKLAQGWMDADVVLPLLDGLDEVAAKQRGNCVEAINTYRLEHGLVPLAVCSRIVDYEALTTKLRLQGAVVIQFLTKQQVDAYLKRAGERLAGVRVALRDDVELREMLDTPLMLSIVTLAYADKLAAEVQTVGTSDERRRHLFDAYIAAMFQRRSKEARYPQSQTLHWLSWLARRMTRQAQTVFVVEHLQADWLSTRAGRLQYVLLDRLLGWLVGGLLYGLVFGPVLGLVYGLVGGLVFGFAGGLVGGLVALFFGGQTRIETLQQRPIRRTVVDALAGALVGGLLFGLVGGLVYTLGGGPEAGLFGGLLAELLGGLLGGLLGLLTGTPSIFPRQVVIIERLRWVWSKAWRSAMSGLVIGLVLGVVSVLVVAPLAIVLVAGLGGLGGLGVGLTNLLVFGLIFGLCIGLIFGLIDVLVGGLNSGPLTATIRVNQGIRRSARSALVGGLVGGLLGGLAGGLVGGLVGGWAGGLVGGLRGGLVFGLLFGMVCGVNSVLAFGGYTCLSHLALRLVLAHNGSLPLHLIPFLDYCAERIFLRKVGGGYIFIHRLLMEHFASLYTEERPAASPK